jgi:2,4-dienoyl-CoA reductase-like NADH-dependent reductase (Old Yellow Enzyme family)
LKEIITKARESVDRFPMLIKMNCTDHVAGGIDIETFPEIAKEVSALGFDAIEVSGGMWDCLIRSEKELGFFPLPIPEARTRISSLDKQSYFVQYAEKLGLHIPVIVVGGHRNIEKLEEIISGGTVDFFASSRPLISEPDLPNRWLEGRGSEKADCVSCNSCLLELKFKPLKCVLKQNQLKQNIVKNLVPHTWKLIFK